MTIVPREIVPMTEGKYSLPTARFSSIFSTLNVSQLYEYLFDRL